MTTKVVNKYKEDYDIYIGRPSKYGNPFILEVDGDRDEICDKHLADLRTMNPKELSKFLKPLVGKKLGCFCKPKRCHGDNFLILIKELGLE